jgi:hypothetical protein
MLWSLAVWSMLLVAIEAFGAGRSSPRVIVFTGLIMFPILLLGAYLRAHWRWKDFEKKYRDEPTT